MEVCARLFAWVISCGQERAPWVPELVANDNPPVQFPALAYDWQAKGCTED